MNDIMIHGTPRVSVVNERLQRHLVGHKHVLGPILHNRPNAEIQSNFRPKSLISLTKMLPSDYGAKNLRTSTQTAKLRGGILKCLAENQQPSFLSSTTRLNLVHTHYKSHHQTQILP
ncbi:hypothetical protein BpHYR1_026885 [Brachionus plicatilis]|uniref:Uncharacterized protein n=1 Tax=Brachionus plicatilis TaxID=10195 RepID=A0A3M7T8H1_BRAPC|nr:hypothetical protein BpHYR1_026885 [Brachionus plicatilis]